MRIIDGGIGTYLQKGTDPRILYRKASETMIKRNISKLIGKNSWYKGWQKGDGGGASEGGETGTTSSVGGRK